MAKTLLLADDSPAIQRVVSLTFAGEDIRVMPVSDGDQAIEVLKRTRPDVVIADVAMPGRTGYDVAAYIRQSADLADVPVLLLAGAFDPVDPARAQAVGASGVLTKPFAPAAIVGRVRELLGAPVTAVMGETNAAAPSEPVSAGPSSFARHAAPLDEAQGSTERSRGTEALSSPRQSPAAAEAPAASVSEPAPAVALDDYFEQIDRAFAELKATRRPLQPAVTEEAVPGESPTAETASAVSLPDAFTAMLAEESGEAVSEPLVQRQAAPAPSIDMDLLVDQVAARVLATMSDRVIRATVTDIVSSTAERLVREEIERIKRDLE